MRSFLSNRLHVCTRLTMEVHVKGRSNTRGDFARAPELRVILFMELERRLGRSYFHGCTTCQVCWSEVEIVFACKLFSPVVKARIFTTSAFRFDADHES